MTSRNKEKNHFEICVSQETVILSDNIKNREEIKHIKIHAWYIAIEPETEDKLMPVFHEGNIPCFMNLECRFFCDELSP